MGSMGLGLGAAPSNQMLQPSPKGLNLQALEKFRAGLQPDSDNMMGRGGNGMTVSQNMGKLGFTGMGGMGAPQSGAPTQMPPGQGLGQAGSGIMGIMRGAPVTGGMGGMGKPMAPQMTSAPPPNMPPPGPRLKKGGAISLKDCKVSTHKPSKKNPNF
jgi:hypothetical protein